MVNVSERMAEIFPGEKLASSPKGLKVNVSELNAAHMNALSELAEASENEVTVKRSGAGLVVIVNEAESKPDSLEQWMGLFYQVHGKNGAIALAWLAACHNKDLDDSLTKLPHLFACGTFGTGKTAMGRSMNAETISYSHGKINVKGLGLIMLDEFTNHPDYDERIANLKNLYGDGKSVYITSHELPLRDEALFDCCLTLHFEKSEFSPNQKSKYSELVKLTSDKVINRLERICSKTSFGLSKLLAEEELKETLGYELDNRIKRGWVALLSIRRATKNSIPWPFEYDDFLVMAAESLERQIRYRALCR